MKKRGSNKLEHEYSETLGEQMATFAEDKCKTVMKYLDSMSGTRMTSPRDEAFGRISLHTKQNFLEQKIKEDDFVYLNPPVLQSLDENITETNQHESEKDDYVHRHPPVLQRSGENITETNQPESEKGTILPLETRKAFSHWLDLRLPAVYIHQSHKFDEFLRDHHADAMTSGRIILFRRGKLDLRSSKGLGLLGHELTHVSQQQTNDWRNSLPKCNVEQAESMALENERYVIQRSKNQDRFNNLSQGLTEPLPPPDSLSEILGGNVSNTPMFADAFRNINESQNSSSEALSMSVLSENEMMKIKDEIYQDLMMRIKVEFERGA